MFGSEFAQIYGLTETGNTAVCLPPADHVPGHPRMKAAGRPYPGFRCKAVDRDGAELPPGAVGEICLSTPARMVEYWGLPDRTAETLVDGWVRTGDAGYVDEDGYVFIRDRIKDAILVAGENVYPAEIENALERHPGVAEAVVVGTPTNGGANASTPSSSPPPAANPPRGPAPLPRRPAGRLQTARGLRVHRPRTAQPQREDPPPGTARPLLERHRPQGQLTGTRHPARPPGPRGHQERTPCPSP